MDAVLSFQIFAVLLFVFAVFAVIKLKKEEKIFRYNERNQIRLLERSLEFLYDYREAIEWMKREPRSKYRKKYRKLEQLIFEVNNMIKSYYANR